MHTVTIQEAQARLGDIIRHMTPGEEIVITSDDEPVAALVGRERSQRRPRSPGCAKDSIVSMAEDFDAPLDDYEEYMR